MSKITVTTIAGATSGADANKVKIESGDTLEVVSGTASINNTSNGTLASFKKSGTTIGHIGVHDDDGFFFTRGASQQGIVLKNSSLMPCNTDGSNSDNDQDLGISSVRWKDLYVGGGIYLGGTAAANKLDDYEEGTWTPTAGTNSGSFDSGTKKGRYTKIGDMVFILAFVQFTGASTNANRFIGGLPFTVEDVSGLTGVDYFGHSWNGNHYGLVQFAGGGTDLVDNYSAILAGSFASSGTTRLYGWYKTSS